MGGSAQIKTMKAPRLMLTTQYLEEADQLADRIAIIDKAFIVREGKPQRAEGQCLGSHVGCHVSHDQHELCQVDPDEFWRTSTNR